MYSRLNSFQVFGAARPRMDLKHLNRSLNTNVKTANLPAQTIPVYHQQNNNAYYANNRFVHNTHYMPHNIPTINGAMVYNFPPLAANHTGPYEYRTSERYDQRESSPLHTPKTASRPREKEQSTVQQERMNVILHVINNPSLYTFMSLDDVAEGNRRSESRYLKGILERAEYRSSPSKEIVKEEVPDIVIFVVNEVIPSLIDEQDLSSGKIGSRLRPPAVAIQQQIDQKAEVLEQKILDAYDAFIQPDLDTASTLVPEEAEKTSDTIIASSSKNRSGPQPSPENSGTYQLCEFYRTTPIDELKKLLNNRWKFNQTCNCCGETPFHFAVRRNSNELMNILSKGAKFDETNKCGQTPLHIACEINSKEMVTRLLDLKADPLKKNNQGETCMSVCKRRGHLAVAEIILEKTKLDPSQNDSEDCLLIAVCNGSKEFTRLFLKFQVNINYRDENGNSAISLAVQLGHDDILDFLLKNGANPHEITNEGDTLLHLACKKNREKCVKKLLLSGASVHAANNTLERPLHIAAQYSNLNIVHMLLTRNSYIEAEDSWQRTPLHIAISHNRTAIVQYLLKYGASTRSITSLVIKAIETNQTYMIKLLVAHGLNINKDNPLSRTLFETAIKYNNVDIINLWSDINTSRDL